MTNAYALDLFISYAHVDEDHQRRLAVHLGKLQDEGLIDSWTDLAILPGQAWDDEIRQNLERAEIVLLLLSRAFLASEYVRAVEIPLALSQHREGKVVIVPVLLEECEWQEHFAAFQALPPTATPIAKWPSRDVAYAEVARGIGALARERRAGIAQNVRHDRESRHRRIFRHSPLCIGGENYDPFRAFEQVFRRAALYPAKLQLPLDPACEADVEFAPQEYEEIFAALRDTSQPPGLGRDLLAIPYFLLGHAVTKGLLQPLDLRHLEPDMDCHFAWWHEMGIYQGQLYGVPFSSLTMLLAVRQDLFERYELPRPETWSQYQQLIDTVIERRLPVAPALLQGRHHITLWYDWLTHLYAHDANDLVLYGGGRQSPHDAAETLRPGTESYLGFAARLAPFADGKGALPHWATASWDDGIEQFGNGNLLTHLVFNDALDTLRRRMETRQDGGAEALRVEYLPVPRAIPSDRYNAHVEGWILCVPSGTRYGEVANEILEWFVQRPLQQAYARWGGASADLAVIDEQAESATDGGAGRSFKRSAEDGLKGRTVVDLIKHNGPRALAVIDRVRANLHDAVLDVAGRGKTPQEATDIFVRKVEQRLRSGSA